MEYVLFAVLVLYLTPWLVSEWRGRGDAGAILALNLVTGWTVVGWLGALWWAQGAGALPWARAPRRPALRVVPHRPDAAARRAARRRRRLRVAAVAAGAAALLAGEEALRRTAPALPAEVVAVDGLGLRAAPDATRAVVGRLPAGCRVAVLEARGEWRRVWRTADCPDGSRGHAGGWIRGAVTRIHAGGAR